MRAIIEHQQIDDFIKLMENKPACIGFRDHLLDYEHSVIRFYRTDNNGCYIYINTTRTPIDKRDANIFFTLLDENKEKAITFAERLTIVILLDVDRVKYPCYEFIEKREF